MRFKVSFVLEAPAPVEGDAKLWLKRMYEESEVSQLEIVQDDSPIVPDDCPF